MINFFRRIFGKTVCQLVMVGWNEYKTACGENYILTPCHIHQIGEYDVRCDGCGRRLKVKK